MHMYVYELHFDLSFVAFVVCTAKTSCLHPSRRMKRKNKHADETFFLATARTNEKKTKIIVINTRLTRKKINRSSCAIGHAIIIIARERRII